MNQLKEVLVLSPHTDDGELGAGGTISRLVENGSHVKAIVFSKPFQADTMEKECVKALNALGVEDHEFLDYPYMCFPSVRQEILQYLYEYDRDHDVDLVFTPSTYDHHQDHEVISNESARAFRKSTILGYILPWNHIVSHANFFIPLQPRHVKTKLKALKKYRSQNSRIYFNPEHIKAILLQSGIHIGYPHAEAFELIKFVGWHFGGD